MLRLFAAIPVEGEVADRLAGLQQGLGGWRLTRPDIFHITLAFFGEIDEATASDLDAALRRVDGAAMTLWLDGVDVFGGDRPRLAYAAVRMNPDLTRLRDKVRRAAGQAGITLKAERYTPHVTLARGGARADARLGRWLAGGAAFLAGPIDVRWFGLYRSDLGRGGPAYFETARYPLVDETPLD